MPLRPPRIRRAIRTSLLGPALQRRALAGLKDEAGAIDVYTSALALVPHAQSASLGLMALEFSHDDVAAAEARAAEIRAPKDTVDPCGNTGTAIAGFSTVGSSN